MENQVQIFKNEELNLGVRVINNEDGSISVNAEDTAKGFGWTQTEIKNQKEYTTIKWSRINKFCKDLGFDHKCTKDDYIPESLFYRLGMKANNDKAQKYQSWLADDVIPNIRKHGAYMTESVIEKALTNPDFLIQLATQLKEEKEKRQIAENEVGQFLNTNNLLKWDTVAKNLKIGKNTMLRELREMKILQTDEFEYRGNKCHGERHNVPYQAYMKYFEVKYKVKGDKRYPIVLVKANGQEYLYKRLSKANIIQ